MPVPVRVFVQARMSSHRFPGKVLAPFKGKPLICHVLSSIECALPHLQVVVATSSEKSDDPLSGYLGTIGIPVFRGPLENTFERFRMCVREFPCEWVLRVSGDSPLLDAGVLRAVVDHADNPTWDLVTTIFPRTFPRGQNAELIRVSTFLKIDAEETSVQDQEHVTAFYYRHPHRFKIFNVESEDPGLAELSFAVDTVEDLSRLEQLSSADLRRLITHHRKSGKVGRPCEP